MKWSGEQAATGFDPHSIFYHNDDVEEGSVEAGGAGAKAQKGEKKEPTLKPFPENEFQPFLSNDVAAQILQRAFLK